MFFFGSTEYRIFPVNLMQAVADAFLFVLCCNIA